MNQKLMIENLKELSSELWKHAAGGGRMKILVDKMPEKAEECLWAHIDSRGYLCYARGNYEWCLTGCSVYYGRECPYLRELKEEEDNA